MFQQQKLKPLAASTTVDKTVGGAWNELLDLNGQVRPHWKAMHERINGWTADQRKALLKETSRMLDDLGTTFNVYRDVGGALQPFEIDPIPFILEWQEWETVQKGLTQRMKLLEAVLADLYGPQKLLKDGLIPPDLVHASPDFYQSTRDVLPAGAKWLMIAGCDLIRTSQGTWTVLRDHTHSPGGLGQTLENRSVVSSVLPDLFEASQVAKLKPFFDEEHNALRDLETSRGGVSSIVFLTPGYQHPSYFEHAYKARLLGISLVEAADLTVRERQLFLKTLGGLRHVDGVISRLDDNGIDPLEFWTSGKGGVPGLIEAWRSGNVAIMNAPGSGFASSPALQPFLRQISKKWFGEDLILPFVESWWLGQKSVRDRILGDLSPFILLSAFGRDPLLPVKWANLSATSKKEWTAEIQRRPWDFVAQEDITPSRVPSLHGRTIQTKPAVLRSFTLNGSQGYEVLPGGLARVGKIGTPPQLWPEHEGLTKDVWLTGKSTSPNAGLNLNTSLERDRLGAAPDVPSRIAEQLYWVGRYVERVEMLTRMLRVTLRHMEGESGSRQREQVANCIRLLKGSGIVSQQAGEMRSVSQIANLIFSKEIPGSLTRLLDSLLINASSARDRLSDDTWIFFNQLKNNIDRANRTPRAADLLYTLDRVVLHLAAFSGMQAENMIRGQGWRFLETGRRIERGWCISTLLQVAASDDAVLEPLIEICDSAMTYRRKFFSKPDWSGVIDLLFLDRFNPRSVGFQIQTLAHEVESYPGDKNFGLFPKIAAKATELNARFDPTGELNDPDADELKKIATNLEKFSDLVTQHYFSHSVRRVY